ncbi:hypothetical protein [Catellatospora sp. TT07R-123]|uniref:hypothetical protein n=1 Tax=Catellatospora sp. TT07R-123 TaxID=2733863 RepID=UPI001BB37695|nr:hypothetical protein [Catellatospora sp. TT07R-123]
MYWVLVVTGDQRGNVWFFDEYGAHPADQSGTSISSIGTPPDPAGGFVRWVARWQAEQPSRIPVADKRSRQ